MSIVGKVGLSVCLLLLIVSIRIPATRSVIFENPVLKKMDGLGETYLDESLTRAATAFALARAANAVISTLQESQVQATLFGAGVTIALGQILDPVNDLIERFSWVMLASMTSLGVQKFFIQFGNWVSIEVLLTVALAAILCGIWLPGRYRNLLRGWGYKILLVALLVRFFIPLAGYANFLVYDLFLAQEYEKSIVKMDVEEFREDVLGKEEFKGSKIKEKLIEIKNKAAELTQYLINLIIVFSIQNVVLPLLTAWLFLKALGRLSDVRFLFSPSRSWDAGTQSPGTAPGTSPAA